MLPKQSSIFCPTYCAPNLFCLESRPLKSHRSYHLCSESWRLVLSLDTSDQLPYVLCGRLAFIAVHVAFIAFMLQSSGALHKAVAEQEQADATAKLQQRRCKARVWNGGDPRQCSRNCFLDRHTKELSCHCRPHAKNNPHGNIDEGFPDSKLDEFLRNTDHKKARHVSLCATVAYLHSNFSIWVFTPSLSKTPCCEATPPLCCSRIIALFFLSPSQYSCLLKHVSL